jgi:hypothetical protein
VRGLAVIFSVVGDRHLLKNADQAAAGISEEAISANPTSPDRSSPASASSLRDAVPAAV